MDRRLAKEVIELSRLWGGFRASRVILTANNLGVFEAIGKGTTASGLAAKLRSDLRATEILLDALAAAGLLAKAKGAYRLTPAARRLLLPDSPFYQGDMLRHADTLWRNWSGLDEVVMTGRPNRSGSRHHDVFIRAMHNNAVLRAGAVIESLDLRRVRRALDLGGGPGTYSIELAKRGISVTLFDLPDTVDVARGLIRKAGAAGITIRGGDFHFDDLGNGYDLVLVSQVLHSHSAVENIALLGKVFDSLAPNGIAAVHEFLLNENRSSPLTGALFSVNMLVNTENGRSYTSREIKGWLSKTGFRGIRTAHLGDTMLITGKK